MFQVAHHHHVGAHDAIDSSVKMIEPAGIPTAHLFAQSFETVRGVRGVVSQWGVNCVQMVLERREACANVFCFSLRGWVLMGCPRHRICSRVFIFVRGSLVPARIFARTAGWLAMCSVAVIAFHSASDTKTAECRRPTNCTGPCSATSLIRAWRRARAWLAGMVSRSAHMNEWSEIPYHTQHQEGFL